MTDSVDLREKFASFDETWTPKIIAQYNDNDVMAVKATGEFNWHSHPDTDDFFFVLKGKLRIDLPDGAVTLGPGQMYVVPKGVEHRPVALEDVEMIIIEPQGVPNTGDAATAATKEKI